MTPVHLSPALAAPARRGEAGSAYMIVLLALVVLTILALSLAFLTQGEVQIGANERITNRVFYAAEAGLHTTAASALGTGDYTARTYTFTDPGTVGAGFKEVVDVSPFLPILDSPCNLCEINNAGTYSQKSFRDVTHAVTATSTRYAMSDTTTPLSTKMLGVMVELQPWQSPAEAYVALDDPVQLAKIKF